MKTNTQKLCTRILSQKTKSSLFALLGVAVALVQPCNAIEDPLGCSRANGGEGNNYISGIGFVQAQAHIGDAVQVVPAFGMIAGACRLTDATGTVHIATGILTNYLNNVTLDPGILVRVPCELPITPELVGAGVSSPHGSVEGRTNLVLAIENVVGTLLSGSPTEAFANGFHAAAILIVKPAIQVFQQCVYPSGQAYFQTGQNVEFSGYVTNCGDITLTNVVVVDPRTGALQLFNPTNGLPFQPNVLLQPGDYAVFSNRFLPTEEETRVGGVTIALTATARDTTMIGGPNACVTNSMTAPAIVGPVNPPATLAAIAYTEDHQLRFDVMGQEGVQYAIQAAAAPNSTNWISIYTNTSPFTFVDRSAGQYAARFYRAMPAFGH